ncbi:unnamed protein product [Caenorhabditis sp. 36 PRJEB53466]|nr:unnamed protein product [Caenorhabditis sp. 36 PRJEB53466]
MNPTVVAAVVLLFSQLQVARSAEDRYEQAMMLTNAVIGEVKMMENKDAVQEVVLTDDQILEMYPEVNRTRPKEPPMSIMSGKIPDHLIKKMADYLYGLLQGTGEVVKPTTSSTTTTTTTTTTPSPSTTTSSPELLPFRQINKFFDDLAVIRDAPKVAEASNFVEIRRKYPRRYGLSRKKSESCGGRRGWS